MESLPTSEQLYDWLSSHADDLVGAAFSVVSSDGQREFATIGRPDMENADMVSLSTPFMLGSTLKVLTATLVCSLAEQGEISLEDSIVKWLPESVSIYSDPTSEASIRQLLSHSGGLVDFFEPVEGLADLLSKLARYGLLARPGEIISYSNAGYMLLGALLERITGSSWASLAQSKVLNPLQISDTLLGMSPDQPNFHSADGPAIAEDHVIGLDGKIQRGLMWPRLPGIFAPAGTTAAASIEDTTTLFSSLLWGGSGGALALKQSTLHEMQSIQKLMPGPSVFCEGWGLGWGIIDAAMGIVGHTGGTSTFILGHVKMGRAACFLSNTAHGAQIGRALAFRALGLEDPRAPASIPRSVSESVPAQDYRGRYGTSMVYYDVFISSESPAKLSVVSSLDKSKTLDLEPVSVSTYLGDFAGLPTEFTFVRGDGFERAVKFLHVAMRALSRVSDYEKAD